MTSADLVAKVKALEDKSDLWAKSQEFFKREWNLAAWTGLTACARALEQEVPAKLRGGAVHQTAAVNISVTAYQLYRAARRHGRPQTASKERLRWTVSEALVGTALREGYSYALFGADFPAWHKEIHSLVSVDDHSVRFQAPTVAEAQRYMAYEKGIRPSKLRSKAAGSTEIETDAVLRHELAAIASSMTPITRFRFRHDPLNRLHSLLFTRYDELLSRIFNRSPVVNLGGYDLLAFRRFHAALLAVSGTQEHITFLWKQKGNALPLDDLLLVYERDTWVQKLAILSSLSTETTARILDDLTLPPCEVVNKNLDMYPFVSLDDRKPLLAIIPGLVLVGNSEANIIRICATRNKRFADVASTTKEDEAREDLRGTLKHLEVLGPIKLPKKMPDIDLTIVEASTESILIAELKWLQKPMTIPSRLDRDKEIRKGVRQIAFIKAFLSANPDYLVEIGKMARPLTSFTNVYYAVICRDYITRVDQSASIISYEVLKTSLNEPGSTLPEAYAYANSSEWLPAIHVDYRFDPVTRTCNGVTVHSEMFVPLHPDALELL